MNYSFIDYLTGTVTISASAPESWQVNKSLLEFYENPNSPIWGKRLSRVLYHESIHFWQFLSSGYIANFVNEEWIRLLHFEAHNEIKLRSEFMNNYWRRKQDEPFSPSELVECWARYWDVHTRGPHTLMKEDRLKPEASGPLEIEGNDTAPYYTALSFDTVMKKGPDSKDYARPYLWMLEQATGDTKFVNFMFPLIMHHSFVSIEPVLIFCKCFQRAKESRNLQTLIRQEGGDINQAWLNIWNNVVEEAILPTIQENHMPNYTSGLDVIQRGRLHEHPIFSQYLIEVSSLRGHLKMMYEKINQKEPQDDKERFERDLVNKPFYDINNKWTPTTNPFYQTSMVFGLPGQPLYRSLLGQHVTPPRVKFRNFTYSKSRLNAAISKLRSLSGEHSEESDDETFESLTDNLTMRVRRFQRALRTRNKD